MAYNEKLRITKALDGDRQLIDSKVYRVKFECALSVKVLSYTLNFQEPGGYFSTLPSEYQNADILTKGVGDLMYVC